MGKKQFVWIMVAVLLGMPIFQARAQDDLQATLDLLTAAYQHSAAVPSYAAQWDSTISQSTQLTQGDTVYVISTEITESQTAQIVGTNTSSTVIQRITQGQMVVPGQSGAPLPEIEMMPQLELEGALIAVDGGVFVNLDDTAPEYRAGLPGGWQEVLDGTALGGNGTVSLTNVATSLDRVRMDAVKMMALLNPAVVKSAEVLTDDELDGQVMTRYLLTLDTALAMAATGQDASALLGDLELSEAAVAALLDATVYTLEVWVGADDQMVYRQITTLNLDRVLDSVSFGSDLGGAAVTISHHQSDTLTLSELNADFDIRMPLVEEGVG